MGRQMPDGYLFLSRPVASDYDGELHWELLRDRGMIEGTGIRYRTDGPGRVVREDDGGVPVTLIGETAPSPDGGYRHRVWEIVYADARKRYGARKGISMPQPPDPPGTAARTAAAIAARYPQPQIRPPAGAMSTGDVARHTGYGIGESTVRAYLARGQMPAPDGYWASMPWWQAETVERWLASRPGRGNRSPRS